MGQRAFVGRAGRPAFAQCAQAGRPVPERCGLLVCSFDGDVGFADVGERAFQMGAHDGVQAVLVQTRAQIHFGGLQLSEQCPSQQFNDD